MAYYFFILDKSGLKNFIMHFIDERFTKQLPLKLVKNVDVPSFLFLMALKKFKPQQFHRTLLKPLDGIFVKKL